MPVKEQALRKFKISPLPRGVYIAVCAFPAVLTVLFYALRTFTGVMDFVSLYIAAPVRTFFGMITSPFPFSIMEVSLTVLGLFFIYYIIKSIRLVIHSRGRRLLTLLRRLLHITVAVLYIWGAFCWLWNVGYFARGFAERNGLRFDGATVAELVELTQMFAGRASELAPQMRRDNEGRFAEDRREMLSASDDIFTNIAYEFPELGGRTFRVKPMMYSWLMSRTGYTGIYFALTGEAHVNTQAPGHTIPATIAHELAHQLGVFAEDEANFVAIIAAVSSDNIVFQYSGYYLGLMYLMSAMRDADQYAWLEIYRSLAPEVRRDWNDSYEFWRSQRTVDTGITFVDTILTAVTETLHDTVNAVYDGFLRANDQELGLLSYGACVDLLLIYFRPK